MKPALLVALSFTASLAAQTYTLTEHGRACGADLAAQVVQGQQATGLRFTLRSRLDNSVAALVMGSRAPQPVQLPGGRCDLLVHPRATLLGTTDANGTARFAFPVPPVLPIQILFQGVVVGSTPAGRRAASSDVVRLRGR